METKIIFRAIIEVLGKPKEHVEFSLKEYLKNLKDDKRYNLTREEIADIKQQDKSELWAIFAEVEVETGKVQNLVDFCFDFMPSLLEIIEPDELHFKPIEITHFLNDLQAKLHGVDMIAKQLKAENDNLKFSVESLLSNQIMVLLKQNNLASEQLSKFTGVKKEYLEDFLDKMIDQGKVDLKEGIYFLKGKQK